MPAPLPHSTTYPPHSTAAGSRPALRRQLQHTRDTRATRKALERDLATYTSQSDLDDLHAILDRYSDEETAEIRRILARRAA